MNDLSRLFLLADKLAKDLRGTRESDGAKWSELSGKSALSPAKKSK